MTPEAYETTEMVLDEQMSATCTATKATSSMIWKCASAPHFNAHHYFVREI